jgi:4-hydroxy-tetrahydrodipicolinate reductase
MHRVIVWGTGFVGKAVLRSVATHPAYEIVAVVVNDPEKDGRDVGEILGTTAMGLAATRDSAAALAMEADAVAYFGPNAMHAETNMANLTAALRAGKNVVDTSMGVFQNPSRVPPEIREPIEAACHEGGSTFFSGGIDPGFANDLFPLTLLGLCGHVKSVRSTEFIDGGSYPDQESLRMMGLQSRMDETPLLDTPGMMTGIWGGPLYMIAEALGVEVSETREVYRRWGAPHARDFPFGRVEPNECAAHRIELQGIVLGEPRIVIDHLHRLYPGTATPGGASPRACGPSTQFPPYAPPHPESSPPWTSPSSRVRAACGPERQARRADVSRTRVPWILPAINRRIWPGRTPGVPPV